MPAMLPAALLVLPDLFPGSGHALPYAARLAEALQAGLLLLHVRQDELLTPEEHPGLHTRRRERQSLAALQTLASKQAVPTETVSIEEFLPEAVGEIVREHQPLALVLSCPNAGAVPAEVVTGTALDLLRHISCPLLVLPPGGAAAFVPHRLTLAVDGHDFTLPNYPHIVPQLLTRPGATLDIVYVTDQKDPGAEAGHRALHAVRRSGLAAVPEGTWAHIVYNPDTAQGILQGAAERQADLLVVVARHHSLWGSLFHRSITGQLIDARAIPLLLLPALD
ncbi:hypothetical protein GCM10028824_13190 [Hymenobacter segetis]